jgi:predicted exporter/lauroyl/myristoyl acyltransferase
VVSPIQFIVSWAHRRRLAVISGALVLILLSSLGLTRLAFDADVLSLLPRHGEATGAFRTFLQRFGSLDQLFVVFTAPEGHAIGDYSDDVDRWIVELRAVPEIQSVDAGTAGPERDWAWLADHQLVLLRDAPLDTALARLQPDGMAAALASTRELLTMPSPAVAAMVRQDPLDLLGLLRQQLGGARAGILAGLTDRGYVSADGRRRLVVARPRMPPFDTEFSRQLMQRLETIHPAESGSSSDEAETRPPLEVAFAGGHRIAIETEAQIRRESIVNGVGSLLLILPLLYFVFRSAWLLVCGALPSLVSLAVALGLMGLGGATLSAAATGASAMLFGLGIDGVVLVYIAHRLALAEGLGVTEAVATLGGPSASMLLGMLTTAATFYGLVFVDFPSLQQLGLVIGHSMVACGVLTLLLVPALLPHGRPRGPIRVLTWPGLAAWIARRRGLVLGASAAATLALGAAAVGLRVDTSLERMRSTTPGAQVEESVRQMFGLPGDVYIWLERGPALEPLLQANEAMVARVRREAPQITIDAASALLPSNAAQERSIARVRARAPRPEVLQAGVTRAAAVAGFRPGTLDPFLDRLPRLLDPGQRLTFDGYREHGLGDVIGRFVSREPDGWTLATYAYPSSPGEAGALERIAADGRGAGQLTGLPLVNRELAASFLPQFLRGLSIGSLVVVLMIAVTFRAWRLSALAIVPTVAGLIWAAGLLAVARVPLDLFALFAVVTFVGIGVDYGIHVVHRYREQGDAELAVAQLAPVIVVAGSITLAGYGTLVTSSYPPLRSIGLVSVVSVVALVAASVLLLPALLPLGRSPQPPRVHVPDGNAREDQPPGRTDRLCASHGGVRRTAQHAETGSRRHQNLFSRGVLPLPGATLKTDAGRAAPAPHRWTVHGLNSGGIFAATYHGVRILPRPCCYGIGHVGAWIAWRLMPGSNDALADNLQAVFPDEPVERLRRRALEVYRSYTRDAIDFLKALSAGDAEARQMFEIEPERVTALQALHREGRGIILVTGHHGNWEAGAVMMTRALRLPLTVVAMREASPEVNRIRQRIRDLLGVETLEVRQSLDTPLQIRRALSQNRFVALLVDRHLGRDRVAVTFLGRHAWFLRTPMVMASLTGAPLVPCFIRRIGPGRFAALPGRPVHVRGDLPRDAAIQSAAQEIAGQLEEQVRRHPECWYHFYRYWAAQRDEYTGLD